ncbi:MAG TPA: YcaO-like family protein, partial [Paracoccaceae bacterium]|nr:YcaO-like family protein [Paracoccaceae bacterium]
MARLCRALFRLRHKGGAEVVLVGATAPAPSPADPARATISAGGRGVSLAGAFESCMGEMAERLLARAWNPLAASSGSAPNAADLHPEWIARLTGGEAPATAAAPIAAEDTTGAAVAFPAAALPALRRSTAGCAAAPDRSLAIRHALFELAERHAVALWWY